MLLTSGTGCRSAPCRRLLLVSDVPELRSLSFSMELRYDLDKLACTPSVRVQLGVRVQGFTKP